MKKILILIPFVVLGLYLFMGQAGEQTTVKTTVEDPGIWNYFVRLDWYKARGLTPPEWQETGHATIPWDVVYADNSGNDFTDAPDIMVFPSSNPQSENSIAVNHQNTQQLFISTNGRIPGSNPTVHQTWFFSTNGGLNWFGSEDNPPGLGNSYGDPVALFNYAGNRAYYITMGGPGLKCMWTTNFGVNWGGPTTISTSSNDDKEHAMTDLSGVYPNNLYVIWTDFGVSGSPSQFVRSTDAGATWSARTSLAIGTARGQGGNVSTGKNGEVYATWAHYPVGATAETGMGFAVSTNGGATFSTPTVAFPITGIRLTNGGDALFNGTRVNSFPSTGVDMSNGPYGGRVYVCYSDRSLGDADIYIRYSSNQGTNWSNAIKVNDDPAGKQQWFGSIAVDPTNGAIAVSYYNMDSTGFLTSRWLAISLDGGTTWDRGRVSDVRFIPTPLGCPNMNTVYMGDYYETAASGGRIWAEWIDSRQGAGCNNWKTFVSIVAIGPSITHIPLPNTENTTGPYVVNAQINIAGSPINPALTKLHWSRNNATITDSVAMTNTSGNNWTANIPGNGTAATYRYYIRTYDMLGRVATSPPGAPANLHQFIAGPDNVKPVIQHTPIPAVPKPAFPPTVNAVAFDPADFGGLDSVWVRWYKNTTSTGVRHVKLVNTSGNNFAAPLNADTSYVTYGDTIKYRIFAQDNSSMHNRDSSALFQFPIVATVTKCVGTMGAAAGHPFYTFYMDSKDNMVYTAAEMGLGGPGLIERIGFNVVSAAPQVMNGFNIRMQHTTLTSLSGFITTGWTTVYTGTYAVPGTGMQWINLQNPFQYNGTQNLLVEICFNNSSYTSNSTVSCDPAQTTTYWHRHADLSAGDGCTDLSMTGTSAGGRPYTCFYINTLVGVPNVNIELPKEFRLSQNYPNPFNPTTTINYAIPKAGNVTLTVFDITGREVARLVNGEFKQAGVYNISFDASHLASGMYLYRIESGSFVETKKMVLIK